MVTNRDPYVYSLFEITLSSIDSKLSKMDKVERALEALTDKMDAIDARLSDTARRSDALLGQLKTVEERLGRISDADATGRHQSTIADNLQPRILALDEKVSHFTPILSNFITNFWLTNRHFQSIRVDFWSTLAHWTTQQKLN